MQAQKTTATLNAPPSSAGAFELLLSNYAKKSPARFKLIDAFLLFLFITGVLQFVYCISISDYPFNSFLAGFAATVGQFVLALSLRMQIDVDPHAKASRVSEGRYVVLRLTSSAFGEFLLASIVLHFFVVNFLG